ncbi:MAG TPA: nucleoside deaminase [Sediminispirochaeta sp.]|nr:nucleoside deaminase [Sediminispirochaeta sp.]
MRSKEEYLREAIRVSQESRAGGNHPFGAVLVGPEGELLLSAGNTVSTEHDCTGHAETNLVRLASRKYDRDFLSRCTLYSSAEPCAMCSGAIYWSGIGAMTYALSEESLYQLTGDDPENPTLRLPSREVFARGQRKVEVSGPHIENEARQAHKGFWHPNEED